MSNKLFALSLVSLCVLSSSSFSLISSSSKNIKRAKEERSFEGQVLNIYNSEDYICDTDGDVIGIIDGFEELTGATVNYYTFDTNETMYNQFILQKDAYDLMCTSEYVIQKLVKEDYIQPFNFDNIPSYRDYASPELRKRLSNMIVTTKDGTKKIDDYAVGYMWGTLGIIYDPEYISREDVKSWDVFWNKDYYKQIQVKNSMRDTYVIGIMHAYQEELCANREKYLNGEISVEQYNAEIQRIFDLHEKDDIEMVKNELMSLKENIYGFEVDSGKNDIITGKAKMSLQWSGDAVYSIDVALEQADKVLEYAIPEEGSNIWYDCWVMPKGANVELAEAFLDYISTPESAAKNMDYVGYTPFIGGEDIFELALDYYGCREFDEEVWNVVDDAVYKDGDFYYCIKDVDQEGIDVTNEEYFEKMDEKEYPEPFDVSYFFGDTLNYPAIIYPYPGCENQLECQYPSEEIISRCANMNDFGDANADVIIMWGEIKAYTNMTPYYVFLICFLSLVGGIALFFFIKDRTSLRYKRKKASRK